MQCLARRRVTDSVQNLWRKRPISSSALNDVPLVISPEVREALASNRPVVSLESTLISHGFEYPANLDLSMALEDIVRSSGAIPATIGIIKGVVKIGLNRSDLETLADRRVDPNVVKISRRDIAPALVHKVNGGTTCSATLIFSALAGIKVFATGGLGGVHRGGENSMDISADLLELTRCPVGLVSSGVKSILDIGRTLEYLETVGVPVLAYGQTRDFPNFFTRKSGFLAPWNVDNPVDAAQILFKQQQLQMTNGALFAVPVPKESEADGALIQAAIDQAIQESEKNGISRRGKEATPWLLKRIGELSQGASIEANIALLKNTALIGAQMAVEYSKLAQDLTPPIPKIVRASITPKLGKAIEKHTPSTVRAIVVGSSAVDISARFALGSELLKHAGSTSPGRVSLSLGGVGRNMAEASHRSMTPGNSTLLISPIGEDAFGTVVVNELKEIGMETQGLIRSARPTAVCNLILDGHGNLVHGVADMDITSDLKSDLVIQSIERYNPSVVGIDANLSSNTIRDIVQVTSRMDIPIVFEPTSIVKSSNILPAIASLEGRNVVHLCTPNRLELSHIYAEAEAFDLFSSPTWWSDVESFGLSSAFRQDVEILSRQKANEQDPSQGTLSFLSQQGMVQMIVHLLPFFRNILVKCGATGVIAGMQVSAKSDWKNKRTDPGRHQIVAHGTAGTNIVIQHFPALPLSSSHIVNDTGAGDTFVGVLISRLSQYPSLFEDPERLSQAIVAAQHAAGLTLKSEVAVSPLISTAM